MSVQSIAMPAVLTTAFQRATSSRHERRELRRRVRLAPHRRPCAASLATTSGFASTFMISALTRSTMAAGVFAGIATPNHVSITSAGCLSSTTRRHVGQMRMALGVEDRERPQLARLELRLGEDQPERHELHAPGDAGRRWRWAALVADRLHPDAGIVHEELGGEMHDRAARRAGVRQLARPRLRIGDELGERVRPAAIAGTTNRNGLVPINATRLEIAQRVVARASSAARSAGSWSAGSPRATCSRPAPPSPPARWRCCRRRRASARRRSAGRAPATACRRRSRITTSSWPPAGNGTTMRMGFCGHASCACGAAGPPARAPRKREQHDCQCDIRPSISPRMRVHRCKRPQRPTVRRSIAREDDAVHHDPDQADDDHAEDDHVGALPLHRLHRHVAQAVAAGDHFRRDERAPAVRHRRAHAEQQLHQRARQDQVDEQRQPLPPWLRTARYSAVGIDCTPITVL